MKPTWTCGVWATLALVANAQEAEPSTGEVDLSPVRFETEQPAGLRSHFASVEGVAHAAVVLGVRHGSMHDPEGRAGRAAVIGELLRLYFSEDGREQLGVGVRVDPDATMVFATPESSDFVNCCAALAPILATSTSLPNDLIARAKSRAKLRADDVENVLPGPILRAHAAQVWMGDAPDARLSAGSAEQIQRITDADIEIVLANAFTPSGSFLVVVGSVPGADLSAGITALTALADSPAVDSEVASAIDVSPRRHAVDGAYEFESKSDVDVAGHRLVDAPFMTASLRLPSFGDADWTAHWIAVGVLRGRTARDFQPYRGGEVAAEFPFVDFDPFVASKLVCVNRRGADGHDRTRVRAEIAGVFADLRSHGATSEEVATAARQLAITLALPPFDTPNFVTNATRQPQILTARAYAIAAYERHGWPASLPQLLEKTPIVHVQRVLRAMFDKSDLRWVALEPTVAKPELPWRRGK